MTAQGNKVKATSNTVKLKKAKEKFEVNAKSGQIKVKKGLKNGKYKLTVLISDSGDKNHEAAEAQAVVTINVKK